MPHKTFLIFQESKKYIKIALECYSNIEKKRKLARQNFLRENKKKWTFLRCFKDDPF